MKERIVAAFHWLGQVFSAASIKFYWDDGFSRASGLAYSTLFALVPIIALSFSVVSQVFHVEEAQLRQFLETALPPLKNTEIPELQHLQAQAVEKLEEFVMNVGALNTVSLCLLFFTGLALLNTVESALNVVWRVTSSGKLIGKFINFWAVITLGPVLLMVSLIWTTQAIALSGVSAGHSVGKFLVPTIALWAAFTLLYAKMPAARVRLRDAAFGAFVAALLFELAKAGFAYYLAYSATYTKLYDVLAIIPLFLFWLYITWVMLFFGAEVSYQSGSLGVLQERRKYASDLGEVGGLLGLKILNVIGEAFRKGEPPPAEGEIVARMGTDPVLMRTCLDLLTEAGILTAVDSEIHGRALLIPPEHLKLTRIFEAFLSPSLRKKRKKDGEIASSLDESFLATLKKAFLLPGTQGKAIGDLCLGDFCAFDVPESRDLPSH